MTSPASTRLFGTSTPEARRSIAILVAGIALWAAHLAAVYLVEELLQRAGEGDRVVAGLRLDELLVLATTAVPALLTLLLALDQTRAASASPGDPDRLLAIVSALVNTLMTMAIVAEGIVVLFLPGSR